MMTLSVLLAFIASPALADEDLVPSADGAPALLRGSEVGGVYYQIPASGGLDFRVQGPATLEVSVRQRLPNASTRAPQFEVQALGDGMMIMAIKASAGVDPTGVFVDAAGGVPSRADRAEITVPAGEHVFTLRPVGATNPVLVRVTQKGDASAPVAAPASAAVAAAEPDPLWEEEKPAPVPVAPRPVPAPAQPPSLPASGGGDDDLDREDPSMRLGGVVGLGDGAAGNQASLYLGAELLVGVPNTPFDLSARLGRYGVGLEQQLPVQPALGGWSVADDTAWKTKVRPLELGARVGFPAGNSEVWGRSALAMYYSARLEGEDRVAGVSVGTAWGVGVDIPAGPGFIAPELAIHTGRRGFDNMTVDDTVEARERIGGYHINVAYTYPF